MKVCIAEKPSVAKEIAQVIGATSRKDGYFEGNGYQVTWTFGHFCTLLPPEDYHTHWKKWDLNTLPMLPEKFETKIMNDSGVKKQYGVIKKLFSNASVVINCGDAGQEGELIQRWVINQAKYKGEVKRLWISSLTTEAIKVGFNKLMPASEFDNLYYAGSSRAIGDWLLGMNATRLYTMKYGGFKQVLSIGRVQTPTLAMIVQRHYEILHFKPSPYWELQTVYRDTIFKHVEGKFEQKQKGEAILEKISDVKLTITNIDKKEGKEYAPKLFDLTSLQVFCNNRYGFSADMTLKIVQKLYEMKAVSYPRVDTTFLPTDIYPKVKGILSGLKQYSTLVAPLMQSKIRRSTKVFNDKKVTDHHAIIPTGEEKTLYGDEQKVYDIITRRFLAVFYPDCIVSKTEINAEVNTIQFVTKGKEILDEGWRAVFPQKEKESKDTDSEGDDNENLLPTFEIGENGKHEPTLIEKTTKPPNNYSEASLLRAMETAGKQVDDEELRDIMKANGIGRPSTRANIIETLFKRKYTYRSKKLVLPTEMGIQLIDTIQNELLKSAELTGMWEKQLKEIEQGEYSPKQFIIDMKSMVDHLVAEVRMEKGKPRLSIQATKANSNSINKSIKKSTVKSKLTDLTCPKCAKGKIIKGKSSYGCSTWQHGCVFRMPFIFMGKKLTDAQIKALVQKKQTGNIKGFKIDNEKAEGKVLFDSDFKLRLEQKTTSAKKTKVETMPHCPKCKKGVIIKGKTAYGCSDWKQGCQFRFLFSDIKLQAKGKPLTKQLVMDIISQ